MSAIHPTADIERPRRHVRVVPKGDIDSAHIHGTDVPVEEPSTASIADIGSAHEMLRNKSANGRFDALYRSFNTSQSAAA